MTKPKQHATPKNNLPAEVIKEFIDVQKGELAVRADELQLRKEQESNHKAIAEKSINASLQDSKEERGHIERLVKMALISVCFISVICALLAGYFIYSGNAGIIMKLVEIASYLVAGFLGGFSFKSAFPGKKEDHHT